MGTANLTLRWSIAPPQPALAALIARECGVSPLVAQCLLNRGHSEPDPARRFLDPRLRQLADPFLLPQMNCAVDRLLGAREQREELVIFGDYDVDGVTSTALLGEVLRTLGWQVSHYLPNRMDEGYGLSQSAVENCLTRFSGTSLLLAVDCGSTAVAQAAWLRQRGVDLLVLDHHQVSTPLPEAVAIVNPHCAAPGTASFCELCSVGLAFKLAHALLKRGRELGLPGFGDFDLRPLLDLVALGTVADLVPLTGENRILVTAGLERLGTTSRPGLVALKEVAQCREPIGVYEVGFQLAPRLNAAGRLETAEEALLLLLAPDAATARPLAEALNEQNRERQQIERIMAEEAIGAVRARFDPARDYVIVEGRLLWHIGVVGIVASRVLREFYRPTLILGGEGNEWRGSGRSIPGFDLAAALRECTDLLVRHGGHAMAAGITVQSDRVEALRLRLNQLAQQQLTADALRPELRLDAATRLDAVGLAEVAELDRLGPFGMENPGVKLAVQGVRLARPPQRMGREQEHVKLWLTDGAATTEAVWWNGGARTQPSGTFDIAAAPGINEYNGRRSVQLKILDWRPA